MFRPRSSGLISNIAQIILIVILFPFLAILFWVINGNNASSSFANFLADLTSQIPVCDIWFDVLYKTSSGLTQSQFIASVPVVLLRSIPETLLLTVSVHATNQIARTLLDQRGLPIVSTMVGVILSTVLVSLTGLSSSLLFELGSDLVMVIGIIIMVKAVFGSRGHQVFGLHRILIIVIDALLGIIVCAYVCLLIMVSLRCYSSPTKAIGSFLVVTGIVIIAAVLRYLVSIGEDEYY